MSNQIVPPDSSSEMAKHSKSIVMSLSLQPELQELLKVSAKKAGWSVSKLIRVLTQRHLSLVVNDGLEVPVILKIPTSIKKDPEKLRAWLSTRTEGIVSHFAKSA